MCYLKEIENMCSLFLSRYKNTRKILGEFEKVVETQHFLFSQTSIRDSIKQLDNTLSISMG